MGAATAERVEYVMPVGAECELVASGDATRERGTLRGGDRRSERAEGNRRRQCHDGRAYESQDHDSA